MNQNKQLDMKKLALSLCFFVLSNMGLMAQMTVENDVITVEVTEDSSRNDLLEIRQQLQEYGVKFNYTKVNWIEGQLKSVHLDVMVEDGRIKSFTAMNLSAAGTIKMIYDLNDSSDDGLCLGTDCE